MLRSQANTLHIRTAEGVTFALPLAGPVTRFLAWCIDLAVALGTLTAVGMLIMPLQPALSDVSNALLVLAGFVVILGYPMLLEWYWRGQTIGKRLLRLRVMDVQGLHLQFSQIAIRNLLRAVDFLPQCYVIGGACLLLTRNNQRLGDLAANTVVVHTPRPFAPNFEEVLPNKYNSFRDYPHIEARLRQNVGPEEAAIAVNALLRRTQLEPGERIRLYQELAEHFRGIADFPEALSRGLTDEQYLRNAVDSIFRATGPGAKQEEES